MSNTIKLPEPQKNLDFPLMKALDKRRTVRKWLNTMISEQELSNLLWAACGINKPATKRIKSKRTAPSGCNSQEIRIYVLLENGVYIYNEEKHQLEQKLSKDIREHVGTQKMMKTAPVGLVLVADLSRINSPFIKSFEAKQFCSLVDTGFISQNIYLYCAASNLGTAVLSLVDRNKLHKLMELKEDEKIVVTQVVGNIM